MTTYVVEKQKNRRGDETVVYAGQDADKAKEICDDLYVSRNESGGPLETFIHVWEDGEHQYVTRAHPNNNE